MTRRIVACNFIALLMYEKNRHEALDEEKANKRLWHMKRREKKMRTA